jgi:hypothetical protein
MGPARWGLTLLLLIGGCGGVEVRHTYEGLRFETWRGYAWARAPVASGVTGAPITPALVTALVEEVDAALPDEGLTLVDASEADTIVRCTVVDGAEGRDALTIELSAPRFPQAWVGEARGELLVPGDDEASARRLRAAARDVLEAFPPPTPRRVGR